MLQWESGNTGTGILFDLDARLKVGTLAGVSILLTFAGWYGLLLISILLPFLVYLSGTPLRLYRGVLVVLAVLALFYMLAAGVPAGLMLAWRLGVIFMLTRLFIAVTPPLEQGLGIAYFFTPLARITPWAADFSLLLTLTLRFVATLKEEGELLWKAWMVQGGGRERGLKGLKILLDIIPALLLIALQRAEEVGENMLSRGYASGRYRVVFVRPWRKKDSLALCFILLFWALLLYLNLV